MDCQNGHQHISQELEVLRIHMQLVTVQFTQLGKGALEIIQVLYGISQGSQHLLAMCLDFGVAHDGRGRGQVAKAVKEPLGPWVDNQEPSQGFSSSIFHIHLAPQAPDTYTFSLHLPPPSGRGRQLSVRSFL
uniref:PRO2898 n=1 Tax=Homo sapiens TaxID=9606 RepID=Q9P1C1_HUMAN|nr:PRO2898 [Homo sapiens]